MHHDEIAITEAQVAELIAEQAPRWSGLAVRRLNAAGTVNAIFRVGAEATARFPLRSEGSALVADRQHREVSAMTEFLDASAFPAPEPLLVGAPGHGHTALEPADMGPRHCRLARCPGAILGLRR